MNEVISFRSVLSHVVLFHLDEYLIFGTFTLGISHVCHYIGLGIQDWGC